MSLIRGLCGKSEQRVYPPSWLANALGYGKTGSGIDVSETTALKYTAFFAAVDHISRSVAQLPLMVYERVSDDERRKATNHPIYDLLHTRPNVEQTAYVWRHTQQAWMLTWGNAYAEIERTRAGHPVALHTIPPNRMSVGRDKAKRLVYQQADEKGRAVSPPLSAADVIHIHGLGDGMIGYSPVRLFRESIGLALAAEKYGAAFFGNSARPGGAIKHPTILSDKALARLRASWAGEHQGAENAHKIGILEEGMEWVPMTVPPEDAQLLSSRQFQVLDIARIFHLPPHKLADLSRATFSNIEHQAIEFVQDCLGPWLVAWEQELDYKLFSPAERGRYYCEFLIDGLLRGDIGSRYAAYAIARNNGWMSADDVRRKENMNPLPDGQGKVYLVPANMIPADQLGKGPAEPAPAPEPEPKPEPEPPDDEDGERMARICDAQKALLLCLCQRIVRKEVAAMRKAIRRPETFQIAADRFFADHAEYVCEVLAAATRACAAALDSSVGAAEYIAEFARQHAERARGSLWLVAESHIEAVLERRETEMPAEMAERILGDLRNAAADAEV